jgi:elongation factor P hydroxylase
MLSHIVESFQKAFMQSHQTILSGGASEPLYEPLSLHEDTGLSVVYFKEDFVSSALHEISHWCIAGATRREQVDYGYWYNPKRDGLAQSQFEEAEVLPQALEWILSVACGIPFSVSADNLCLEDYNNKPFRVAVQKKVIALLENGLPERIERIAFILSKSGMEHLDPSKYQGVPS